MRVLHTCGGPEGVEHVADIQIDRKQRLGCGCVRHEGFRCDGSPIHVLTGGCGLHADDLEEPA